MRESSKSMKNLTAASRWRKTSDKLGEQDRKSNKIVYGVAMSNMFNGLSMKTICILVNVKQRIYTQSTRKCSVLFKIIGFCVPFFSLIFSFTNWKSFMHVVTQWNRYTYILPHHGLELRMHANRWVFFNWSMSLFSFCSEKLCIKGIDVQSISLPQDKNNGIWSLLSAVEMLRYVSHYFHIHFIKSKNKRIDSCLVYNINRLFL